MKSKKLLALVSGVFFFLTATSFASTTPCPCPGIQCYCAAPSSAS